MNKFMRICMIVAAIMVIVGVITVGVSIAVGANPDEMREVRVGGLVFNGLNWKWHGGDDDDYVAGDMIALGDDIATEDVKSLKISLGAIEVKMIEGDSYKVEGRLSRNYKVDVYMSGDTLCIESDKDDHFFAIGVRNRLEITVPKDAELDTLNIEIGAGSLNGNISASCDELLVDVGAGGVKLDGIETRSESYINCGMGSIAMDADFLDGVEIDCGMGSVKLSGKVEGDSRLDCGMGSVNLDIDGNESDYRCKADVGLGSMQFGDRKSSGISDAEFGSGKYKIDVSVAMGSARIEFN